MKNQESKAEAVPVNNPLSASKKNPYTIWFVVLSFIAPVTLAYIMFFFVEVESFSNKGEILNPIVHINDFKLKDDNGQLIPRDELTFKWRIISILGKDCDERCQSRIYDTRQIHTSLGKERNRVYRMFIHLEPASDELEALIEKEHPNTIRVNGDADLITDVLGNNIHDGIGIRNNEAYIMDPMGNVMMRFTQEQPNKDFLKDLKKLLKASQIG